MGYYRAGFDVVGVDIAPQKRYPFEFHQADALEYCAEHGREFDVIHASPPCQFASECTPEWAKGRHHNFIPAIQELLKIVGKPYIVENVEGARSWLDNPLLLCGTMFGLAVWRHRYFETRPVLFLSPKTCAHDGHPVTVRAGSNARKAQGGHHNLGQEWMAMGIDWMTKAELSQAIPPIYTEWIGKQLIERIGGVECSE